MQNLTSRRHFALIPAAGVGQRMGGDCPKQYMRIAGKPMLLHALDTFAAASTIAHTYVVVSPDDGHIGDVLAAAPHLSGRITVLRNGGATRQQSVLNGLRALRGQLRDDDWMLVHDAARPGLTVALIDRLVNALGDDAVGGLLALPVVDTLKRSDAERRAQATVSREGLWAAQTPQMFPHELLCRALTQAAAVTDEASAIEALGLRPKLVEGSPRNFKVTLPHDVALAELYLKGLA
jgi:2-C-methyl-D-erythritol 4-phosphate cytidylyltransferase